MVRLLVKVIRHGQLKRDNIAKLVRTQVFVMLFGVSPFPLLSREPLNQSRLRHQLAQAAPARQLLLGWEYF